MNMNNQTIKTTHHFSYLSDIIILGILVFIGIIGRTLLVGWNVQPFPNFELIMVLTFLGALFLRPTLAFLVPLCSMICSDLLLGNPVFIGSQMNKIVLFTYSGFLLIAFVNILVRNKLQPHLQYLQTKTIGLVVGIGIVSTLCYDIWTNIGWWYLLYPHTPEAFVSVFVAGIPFMMYHLISTAITFIVIGIPLIVLMKNTQILAHPKKHTSLHYLPLAAVTLFFIGLSFSGTAMEVPQRTDIWLEHTDTTSVTLIVNGGNINFFDTFCVTQETTVLSVLYDILHTHGIDIKIMYYDTFDATIVTSIGGNTNGNEGYYWQYYVNGDMPICGCDKCPISNGDVIVWSYETMENDI